MSVPKYCVTCRYFDVRPEMRKLDKTSGMGLNDFFFQDCRHNPPVYDSGDADHAKRCSQEYHGSYAQTTEARFCAAHDPLTMCQRCEHWFEPDYIKLGVDWAGRSDILIPLSAKNRWKRTCGQCFYEILAEEKKEGERDDDT